MSSDDGTSWTMFYNSNTFRDAATLGVALTAAERFNLSGMIAIPVYNMTSSVLGVTGAEWISRSLAYGLIGWVALEYVAPYFRTYHKGFGPVTGRR